MVYYTKSGFYWNNFANTSAKIFQVCMHCGAYTKVKLSDLKDKIFDFTYEEIKKPLGLNIGAKIFIVILLYMFAWGVVRYFGLFC